VDTETLSAENFAERVVWVAITATYPLYALGALYVAAPVIAWVLFAYLCLRPTPRAGPSSVPLPVWLWLVGMLAMLVALLAGHLDFGRGLAQTVKSVIGWAKGWALMALFPLLGCVSVRPQLIYRATCIVCLQTLLLLPIFVGAWLAAAPPTLYVSPLQIIGGPGPEFFALSLYEIDPGSGLPRWRMFAPWAPALGLVGNLYFVFATQERHRGWRVAGKLGSLAMVLMSQSRLALVAWALVMVATALIGRLVRPGTLFLGGLCASAAGLAGVWLLRIAEQFRDAFRAARPDSTRVREALTRIALERWQSEAPVWGHGVVERGPHLVEYMMIGSHHSWVGLLFVKGIVGLCALAVPMVVSLADLLLRASSVPLARTGIAVLLILFLFSFGENLEILAYLFWPGLMVLGAAHKTPLAERGRGVHVPDAHHETQPNSSPF
jgi:hypothetical protein